MLESPREGGWEEVKRLLFNLLTVLSLLLLATIVAEELLCLPDDDFSFYWSSIGVSRNIAHGAYARNADKAVVA